MTTRQPKDQHYKPMSDVYSDMGIDVPSAQAPPKREPDPQPEKRKPILVKVIVLVVAAAFIYGITRPAYQDYESRAAGNAAPPQPADEQARESQWIYNGKDAVRSRLKDPDSAKFRNVFFHRSKSTDMPVACGEVNSRNSFGGYAGFERFVSAGSGGNTYLASDVQGGEQAFDTVWERFCIH